MVDHVAERLDLAGALGATPVRFADGDPVEQIRSSGGGAGCRSARSRWTA